MGAIYLNERVYYEHCECKGVDIPEPDGANVKINGYSIAEIESGEVSEKKYTYHPVDLTESDFEGKVVAFKATERNLSRDTYRIWKKDGQWYGFVTSESLQGIGDGAYIVKYFDSFEESWKWFK